ncbi:1-phosphofructokinase family hexose kinase [Virgisporangium ochraceum]|uniref:1-phosphofructokinase n=1 Tax=Virgisporangium ochraceum TaxID=65505 RepID=A0A8J4E8T9_9ACTN|nr:1-phosphofructokinase family hexose kinase [Virgisporangium ochraceum]GIJ65724.1 1-phosphofructokinase [Virgisporangium ochraceum]
MIVTVTLNPSLDRSIEVGKLVVGDVNRATSAHLDPGGKGVNVSRALLANGVASRAVVPCGGDEGGQLIRLLVAEGVDVRAVPIAGNTRSNITLTEPDGTTTKINEPGPQLSPAEFSAVIDQALTAAGSDGPGDAGPGAGDSGVVVACGSAPPGLPTEAFGEFCRRVLLAGLGLVVDTSGPALRAAARAGATLVKPNRDELAEVVGRPLLALRDVIDAAQELRSWGAGAVLASLGADGAVLVDASGVVAGEAPVERPRSSVGAGDALLAGFIAAGGAEPHDGNGQRALAEALAWGAAAVSLPGSRMPGPADLRRDDVRIHTHPDGVRPLLASS